MKNKLMLLAMLLSLSTTSLKAWRTTPSAPIKQPTVTFPCNTLKGRVVAWCVLPAAQPKPQTVYVPKSGLY